MEKTKIDTGNSIMVIVPHQDDEVLMAAGIIQKAVKKEIPVDIVMATNGDYGCRDFSTGRMRLRESLAGLSVLGVGEERLHILGYADTGMPEKDSFLSHLYQEKNGRAVYPSLCSSCTYGLEEKPDIHTIRYGEPGAYCRDTFYQDIKEILQRKQPECILTTAESDLHGDHSALYRFVCDALDELNAESGYRPLLYTGLIHSCAGDEEWPLRDGGTFTCPAGLETKTSLKWEERIAVRLTAPEKERKREALLKYETALEPNARAFLLSFIKDEEVFWRMR